MTILSYLYSILCTNTINYEINDRMCVFCICCVICQLNYIYSDIQLKDMKSIFIVNLKKRFFVSDRSTNMQLTKMQNEIYGSLVTIQYHANVTSLLIES